MYNKAVVFSPNSDDNLARACAERASCLLRLGDYARALADIEQAGVANPPDFLPHTSKHGLNNYKDTKP
jgi:hypothetical protein